MITTPIQPDSVREESSNPPQGRLTFLDGVRAIAALWVVTSHIWISQFGMFAHSGEIGLATNWILYSHFAVDIFIVLSGFCLILPVCKYGGLTTSIPAFYGRRARRILPPFYAALCFSVLALLAKQTLRHDTLTISTHALLINAMLLQDVFLRQNIFDGPFWSIAVEWRIYFLFPLVVWSLHRFGTLKTLLWPALFGYAAALVIFRWEPSMLMTSPWYLLLFVMGCCAGWSVMRPDVMCALQTNRLLLLCWAFAIVVLALVALFPILPGSGDNFGRHMPIIDTFVGAATAVFLMLLAGARTSDYGSKIQRFLSTPSLSGLGRFSYSLYLTHLPCILLLSQIMDIWHLTPGVKVLLLIVCGLPILIAFAYGFFLIFERPFLKSPRFRTQPSTIDAYRPEVAISRPGASGK